MLCIRGTLGKGTFRMYPSLRVPTAVAEVAAAARATVTATEAVAEGVAWGVGLAAAHLN